MTGAFRIQVTGDLIAGSHLDLVPNSETTDADVIICDEPRIVADLFSFNHLVDKTIDYDYQNDEFIISNRGNE